MVREVKKYIVAAANNLQVSMMPEFEGDIALWKPRPGAGLLELPDNLTIDPAMVDQATNTAHGITFRRNQVALILIDYRMWMNPDIIGAPKSSPHRNHLNLMGNVALTLFDSQELRDYLDANRVHLETLGLKVIIPE